MDKLTKSDIAKIFGINKEEIGYLNNRISSYEVVEKREKRFINKVLIPWLSKIKEKISF